MASDDGQCDCKVCHGNKAIRDVIEIRCICPRCKGKGKTDWVSNAMNYYTNDPPNHQLVYNIAMQNIQVLVDKIRKQGFQVGVMIDVDIKMTRDSAEFYASRFYPNI